MTTPAKKKTNKTKEIVPTTDELIRQLLEPLLAAKQEADSLCDDDLHIHYAIQVTRGTKGSGELLTSIDATSTLPGILGPDRCKEATTAVESTLRLSILAPIVAKVQGFVGQTTLKPALGQALCIADSGGENEMASIQEGAEELQ